MTPGSVDFQMCHLSIPHDITYMWTLKYDTNEHIYETTSHSDTENRLVVVKGKRSGGGKYWESWD